MLESRAHPLKKESLQISKDEGEGGKAHARVGVYMKIDEQTWCPARVKALLFLSLRHPDLLRSSSTTRDE